MWHKKWCTEYISRAHAGQQNPERNTPPCQRTPQNKTQMKARN